MITEMLNNMRILRVIQSLTGLSSDDIEKALEMESKYPGIIVSGKQIANERGIEFKFDNIVEAAVSRAVLNMADEIPAVVKLALENMVIRSNGDSWGDILVYGSDDPNLQTVQDIFALYIRYGDNYLRQQVIELAGEYIN